MRHVFFAVGLLGLLGGWLALAAGTSPADLQIVDAWVHETTGPRAVLHLRITSTGVKGDRLVRVSTGLAEKVVIFNQWGQQAEDLAIPADSNWVMGTDAPRIELIGLTQPLKAPETFGLLLGFERAGKVHLKVRVEAPGVNQLAK